MTLEALDRRDDSLIELALAHGLSYGELASVLEVSEADVKRVARASIIALAPAETSTLEPEWRARLLDLVLGQGAADELEKTFAHLEQSAPARRWAGVLVEWADARPGGAALAERMRTNLSVDLDEEAPGGVEAGPRSRPDPWLLGALAILAAALAAAVVISVRDGMTFAFGDAVSHVLIARRIFDSAEPSLFQLGTHWAPLFQLFQLPLVWVDALFRSGASAIAESVAASLVAGLFLYRITLLIGAGRPAAFAAVLLLAASPSFLYIGVVPMLPALVMATTTVNAFYLTRWALERRGIDLVLAGLALSAAMLTHFDTWTLLPVELTLVAVVALRDARSRAHAWASIVLWALAGAWGLAVFLALNIAIYGDLTSFLGHSNADERLVGLAAGHVKHQLHTILGLPSTRFRDLGVYPRAAFISAGFGLAIAGVVGLALHAWRARRSPRLLVPLVLLYPLLTYSLIDLGSGSWISPAHQLESWVNLRYAVTALPPLALLAAVGFKRVPALVPMVAAVIVSGALMIHDGRVATWENARGNGHDWPTVRAAASWLGDHAGDKRTLIPTGSRLTDGFEFWSKLPIRSFVDINASREFKADLGDPHALRRQGIRWLVFFIVDPKHRRPHDLRLSEEAAHIDPGQRKVFLSLLRGTNAQLCYSGESAHGPTIRIWTLNRGC